MSNSIDSKHRSINAFRHIQHYNYRHFIIDRSNSNCSACNFVVASTAKVAEVNCAPYIPPSLSEVQQQKLIIPATRPLRLPPEKFTKLPPAIDPAIPCYVASPIEIGID